MSRIAFLIREAFVSLRRNLLIVAGAILAVFISLTLAFGALVVNEILRINTLAWQDGVHVIAFLKDAGENGVPSDAHEVLFADVQGWEEVEVAGYVSKAEAWIEYQELFAGQEELLDIDPTILRQVSPGTANPGRSSGDYRRRLDRTIAESLERSQRLGSWFGRRSRSFRCGSDCQHDPIGHLRPSG
jgi:hypothetical protein